jgi:hypothetical protein
MAAYDQLPVYKLSYDLLLETFYLVNHFRKEYKYTLGERLKSEILNTLINIYWANTHVEKSEALTKARNHLELTRVYFRIVKDLKQISIDKFVVVNEKVEGISKQLMAWQKSQKQTG